MEKNKKIPKIVLIGAGAFGRHHLRVLKELSDQKVIEFVGVVSRNPQTRKKIESEFGVAAYEDATPTLLKSVDAVDIVTPAETHTELVKKCLKFTHVFVEKPLAESVKDCVQLAALARRQKRILAVGHVFRYHPVTEKLKKILTGKKMPRKMSGVFINPLSADVGRAAPLELLHLFDVVDFLWGKHPEIVYSKNEERVSVIDIRYQKMSDARFRLGWAGEEKKRTITFSYPTRTIEADYILNRISVTQNGATRVYDCPIKTEPLKKELTAFVSALSGKTGKKASVKNLYVAAKEAVAVVAIAERALQKIQKNKKNSKTAETLKPKIAVIGGGIFGTSIAAEVGKFASVTLFERNSSLMKEGSFVNQFRHHYGYHYPRSDETVAEVQKSREDFEEVFNGAIVRTTPTYYGLAKKDSRVSADEFIAFCKKHNLPYKDSYPAAELLDPNEICLCIEVPESSYHHGRLREIMEKKLGAMPDVDVLYNTEVVNVELHPDGQKKIVTYKNIGNEKKNAGKVKEKKGEFDFIINATYANINKLAHWLDFERFDLRVDHAQVLIVKLNIPPVSLTVVDGPFATLMPTGNPHEFTLYHAKESIVDRYVPKDGLIKKVQKSGSKQAAILRESMRFFPILKDAEIVESRIVHRGVSAYREYDDVRIANLIEHGFGCWSILSGKILTSVNVGKRISKIIQDSLK